MYKTWTSCSDDPELLARALEVHLNEFAEEVISVSYTVDHLHYVLAVYRMIETVAEAHSEAAVAEAELIIDEANA